MPQVDTHRGYQGHGDEGTFCLRCKLSLLTFHSTGQRNILVRDDYRIIGLFNDEVQCRWKHAASCHHGSSARNDDVYEKDEVYYELVSLFK
jgi:hypothetical protein